ncbi:hypothetical protein DFA_08384 [Cavenderia fasciculata]|uniref:Transmembrane protein n=1 Tax=Cavenderia fasciculata TaxID=261658 RepID=F4Q5Y0_CACFS|nr:uncharacterized protein DFA_08384 [Cavenderia fasciculata]EGG17389.1 hypothetical protein DFA_08384 [Cavenderia fasciculata]|eukprot:XP_004355873.1 hypothetical protein DFA_08384 [Cavenderia fasciculata]
MNPLIQLKLNTTIKQAVHFGKTWGVTLSFWGATASLGLLYVVQPRIIFKHLPLIGDQYLTAKDIEQQKKQQQN